MEYSNPEQYLEKRIAETKKWIEDTVRYRYYQLVSRTDPESPPERYLLIEMLIGLPEEVEILPQQIIRFPGFEYRVDFLLILPHTKKGIVVECDGLRHQQDEKTVVEDKKRDRQLLLHGYPVFRYTTYEIKYSPDKIIRELRKAIEEFDR